MTAVVSLQTKLIKTSLLSSIVAGILALLIFIGISWYQTTETQDEIMHEVAGMLLIKSIQLGTEQSVDELSDEFEIQYRLSSPNQLITQSEHFEFDTQQTTWNLGFNSTYGLVWQQHQLWRTYRENRPEVGMSVLLVQPMGERFQVVGNSIAGYSLVLLVLWLIQWLILHFAIRRHFRTLQQLSNNISCKGIEDLSPIQTPSPVFKELQPILLQLNQLLTRLKDSLIAEQRFTADASHELRSPLSAIQMRLQVLKRKYPEMAQDFIPVQQDVSRGVQVLENLLLLARLDPAHADQLPRTELFLDAVFQDVLQALQPFSQQKLVMIQVDITAALSVQVNEQLFFTCIRNLVDNAIRYATHQGQVLIHAEQQADTVEISIENSGSGISDEVLQRLGERFYRALGTQTQGSGLGLSICKKIIELHKGKISFQPSKLGGLKVTLQLPNLLDRPETI
ncbi:sensor histidine kinase [Acinetobacter sp. CAAS 2-6]|uniref:sensor histidine kinase n=1 Tax=Acinetobacter sp. CAAS 2-6 TaxID=3016358 RepID=UPI002DD6471B|nr:HAMP domain-containing sensor histidine kinase [Acinetobacter sp. CAAS 2-6]